MDCKVILDGFSSLETERLTIRRMNRNDADDMYEYARLEEVTKYLLWSPHPSRDYTYAYLASVQKYYKNGSYHDYAVVLRPSGRMIGTCGFSNVHERDNAAEIGYVINPAFSGMGYATEAVTAMLRFGFCNAGLNRIEARYMAGNDASRRVMEKCFMTYEGMHRQSMFVKQRYVDIGTCAILKSEFTAKFGSAPAQYVRAKSSLF